MVCALLVDTISRVCVPGNGCVGNTCPSWYGIISVLNQRQFIKTKAYKNARTHTRTHTNAHTHVHIHAHASALVVPNIFLFG